MEQPGQRRPAPGRLALVQAFLNSADLEAGQDGLAGPEQLRAWLVERALLAEGEGVGEPDWRRALELREALRALLLANNGGPNEPDAVEALNRAARDARLVVHFQPDGSAELEPAAPGVAGALAQILAIVYTAMAEGTWPRFKACRNDVCKWAYYDYSKNRSGTWCTMSVCGNRVKVRAYRQQRRRTPAPSPP